MQQIILAESWQLKQRDPARDLAADFATTDGWIPATAPGTVHEALLAAGQIPDPFYSRNEHEVQWIGEAEWLYRCTFELSKEWLQDDAIDLCCDGLDTIATVWLNATLVLTSDNMFVPHRVPVSALLRSGQNVLHLLFQSALNVGKAREATHGTMAVWNGDPSRVFVRKAQYHYGWDWGPTLLTAGPWQTVRLEGGARISDLHCPITVTDDLRHATFPVRIAINEGSRSASAGDKSLQLRLQLIDPDGLPTGEVVLPVAGEVQHSFMLADPQLWWPNGYGEQPLYQLVATLLKDDAEINRVEQRLGVRRLRLVQEPLEDEPGTTFLFEINNTPIFCGGANWIPADSFTTRITPDHYRTLIRQAADANMVMLRVWGGGIYEADHFYDLCDELGLLVWQDFMFGCGLYPAYPEFQASVRAEAEVHVRRLRHHPALALWCGNNEDYQVAHSKGVYDPAFNGDFTTTGFPARAIYERLLPDVCATLDPTRPYWPGSSYGGKDGGSDPTVGDRHTWDVWHGTMAPYQDYPRYEGRFVSEFGMQATPVLPTLEASIPTQERTPQSPTMLHHNKAEGGFERLASYLDRNLNVGPTFEEYVYATQLIQSEALAAAYRGWRHRWAGPGHYAVAGALVWQLDDCWPVTSWAIIDYACRPKPAYYTIRRELAPLVVGLAEGANGITAWVVNAMPTSVSAELHMQGFDLDGIERFTEHRQVMLAPNQANEVGSFANGQPGLIIGARLVLEGDIVARATLWPQPLKMLTLPDPSITITRLGEDRLRVQAERPAKGVWLEAGDDVVWSDNMLDLLPGDPQTLTASGLGSREVRLHWLQS